MQEAAGEVRGSFHQLEEANKVVAVDGSKRLHRKLHLGGVSHLIAKLLHLTAWRLRVRCEMQLQITEEMLAGAPNGHILYMFP